MIDKNLILYLPFDDPDGSKAYDFSQSRADATLSGGATFSKDAKVGKALSLNGDGEAITTKAIPFSSNFTVAAYVKPSGNSLGWLLALPGVDSYLEDWIKVKPGEWILVVFVRNGNKFTAFVDGNQVADHTFSGTPTGFSINDSDLDGCRSDLDEVKVWNKALSLTEVLLLSKPTDVEYYIDGKNFKEFGVYVSKSTGLTGRLAPKEALNVDWDSYHGVSRSKKRKRYKERVITLECFIQASSRSAFVEWMDLFLSQFDGEGNHRLKIEYDGNTKPLVYEVELLEEVDPEKTWGKDPDDEMVGTFKLQLTEDEPVKRVLRHIGTTANSKASVTLSSYKLVDIYWGDGTHTYNVKGNAQTIEHTYSEPGEYDIILAGVIEDITEFSTNAIVIWEILK